MIFHPARFGAPYKLKIEVRRPLRYTPHVLYLSYLHFYGWTLKLNLRDESPDSRVNEFFLLLLFFFDRGQAEEDLYYYSKFLQEKIMGQTKLKRQMLP